MPAPRIPRRACCARAGGEEARLAFLGHTLMENRNGLLMDFTVSPATGTAERDAVSALPDGVWARGSALETAPVPPG